MRHDHPPHTSAARKDAPRPRIWLPLTLATFLVIAAAVLLAEPIPTATSTRSSAEAAPVPLMEFSVGEHKNLADEPDMTGASIAAYDR